MWEKEPDSCRKTGKKAMQEKKVMIVIGTEKEGKILRSIPLPGQNQRMIRRSLHNGNLDFQTDEVRSQEESFMENGNTAAEVEIADTPAEKLTETPIPTKLPILTEQPIPIQTVTASPSVTLTQKPVRKSVTDASKREKKQNPALSYYRTEPTGTSDRKKEKEQKPVIRMKTDGNRIRIEISPDIPFQILTFRINGKECDFYWQGKKLLAKLPKKSRNPWKAELMGFVKSGKLYYETMDLPEKQ